MNEKNIIARRLEDLRELMRREHLGAFIFPSTDPHNSEYVPDHWKGREWISGFNGSAGTAVVTMTGAALWTDSRYFIAAAEQLAGTEFQLMKLKVDGTPTIARWIGQQLMAANDSTEVGIDGSVWCASMVEQFIADLRREGASHQFRPLASDLEGSSAATRQSHRDTASGICGEELPRETGTDTSRTSESPCRRHAGSVAR